MLISLGGVHAIEVAPQTLVYILIRLHKTLWLIPCINLTILQASPEKHGMDQSDAFE